MKKAIILIFFALTSAVLLSCAQFHSIEFKKKVCLEPYHKNAFKLCESLPVVVDDDLVMIPVGFKTDLASIPRIIYPIYSPNDRDSIGPAILHDFLYCCDKRYTKREADDIFYYALLQNKVPTFKSMMYYGAVRFFGETSFQKQAQNPLEREV